MVRKAPANPTSRVVGPHCHCDYPHSSHWRRRDRLCPGRHPLHRASPRRKRRRRRQWPNRQDLRIAGSQFYVRPLRTPSSTSILNNYEPILPGSSVNSYLRGWPCGCRRRGNCPRHLHLRCIWASRYTKVGPNQVLVVSGRSAKYVDPDGTVACAASASSKAAACSFGRSSRKSMSFRWNC